MIGGGRAIVIIGMLACAPNIAAAQSADPALRRGQLILSAGIVTGAGYDIGSRTAEIRRNSPGAPSPFTLFNTESKMNGVTGLEARLGFALTRQIAIEVGGVYAKPQLNVIVGLDPEVSGIVNITDQITRYVVDVSGVWQIPNVKLGPRGRPFVMAGGGSIWELHEDRLIIDRGNLFHVGGGMQYWLLGGGPARRALGARADVRVVRRTGGIEFDGSSRTYPVVSVMGFATF